MLCYSTALVILIRCKGYISAYHLLYPSLYTDLKVQCEEVGTTALEVPEVVYAELRERHSKAAQDCWQNNSYRIKVDMQLIQEKRVRLKAGRGKISKIIVLAAKTKEIKGVLAILFR